MGNRIGLEILCDSAKMDYTYVSNEIGVLKQNFSEWIKGKRNIPKARVDKLSEFFKVPGDIVTKKIETEDDELQVRFEFIKNNAVTATEVTKISGHIENKGIHYFEDSSGKKVIILCTLNGGKYPNEWLDAEKKTLKYYLKSIKNKNTGIEKFDAAYKDNSSVISSIYENYPLFVLVRENKKEKFKYEGEFLFKKVLEDKVNSGAKFFILTRKKAEDYEDNLLKQLGYFSDQDNVDNFSTLEGRMYVKEHLVRERNRALIKKKIEQVKHEKGKVKCECCNFDFEGFYGPFAKETISVHHKRPLSDYDKMGEETNLDDLALCCFNCHHIIHKVKEWLTIDQVKALISNSKNN
ncbi:HNH endonuclease [Bacillus mycoides]|uniref:HNH endonuclease n=1 Tax=Bacillus mycoides TaxID=1405 RepID=UPI003D651F29